MEEANFRIVLFRKLRRDVNCPKACLRHVDWAKDFLNGFHGTAFLFGLAVKYSLQGVHVNSRKQIKAFVVPRDDFVIVALDCNGHAYIDQYEFTFAPGFEQP